MIGTLPRWQRTSGSIRDCTSFKSRSTRSRSAGAACTALRSSSRRQSPHSRIRDMLQVGGGKTAFVLAGGGSLGAVQVGMLKALMRQRIVPDLVVGASVGA